MPSTHHEFARVGSAKRLAADKLKRQRELIIEIAAACTSVENPYPCRPGQPLQNRLPLLRQVGGWLFAFSGRSVPMREQIAFAFRWYAHASANDASLVKNAVNNLRPVRTDFFKRERESFIQRVLLISLR
jgi:hypothetical protein